MAIQKKVNSTAGEYCPVCRSYQHHGKKLQHYETHLDFVCDTCYKDYFQSIAKLEGINPAVDNRPADIRAGEYPLPCIHAGQIVRDTLCWLLFAICLVLTLYGTHACFSSGYFLKTPMFLDIPLLVFGAASFLGTVCAGRQLVQGLLLGMDVKRRLCLAGKILCFLVIGIIMLVIGMN